MKALSSAIVIASALSGLSLAQRPNPRIHNLEELTWPQIDALDRNRTMFVLTIGMVEEHGPHLPVGADSIGVYFEADRVAERVSKALPQWHVVMMPPIGYGETGANEIANRPIHPGTYGLRHSTVRSVVADLGAQVAQNGFKWIFVLTGHGAPTHGIAVNDACDFVSETFGVVMLHTSGVFRADAAMRAEGERMTARHFSAADRAAIGLDVHAGPAETSAILALRPDLVPATYKKLPPLTAQTRADLQKIAAAPDWPGYFSSPAHASAAYGRAVEEWWINGMSDLIVRAARGEQLLKAPRAHEPVDPAVEGIVRKVLDNERAFESKLAAWLERRR